jgi:Holliday junction resolvase
LTEKQFQDKVIAFLRSQKIYHVKVWGGGYQTAGIPDILCCIQGKFVALELKTEKGKPTVLQKYNLFKIQEAGGHARILCPSEFEGFKRQVLTGAI